jgi:N-acetylmuramoyl-L-alanine amidase
LEKFKIGLVVGHTKLLPVAHGCSPLNQYEYHYNSELAKIVSGVLISNGSECRIFLRDLLTLRETYYEVNKYQPKVVVELHFNAANEKARGTETLYGDQNPRSGELAKCVHDQLCLSLMRDAKLNRGIKLLGERDRGYSNVNLAKCPSILTEPFFGDQKDDAKLAIEKKEDIANAIANGILEFLLGG